MASTHNNSSHSEHSHRSSHKHHHHHSSHSHSKSSHSSSSSKSRSSRKKKSKFKHSLRRPVSHLVSVMLTLFVFVFFSLIATLCGAFSESYITKALTSETYIAQLYDAQLTEATALASDYNLSKNIYNNVITQDTLAQHINEYVHSVFNGGKSVDLTAMKNNLSINIENEVKESGEKYDEEAKKVATNFVLTFGEKYFELLEINNLSTITSLKIPFIVVFVICEILLALLIPIFALLIDRSHRNTHKTTRQLAYAFIGAGMLTFAVPFISRLLNIYGTLQAWREHVYNFFILYFNHIMNVWMLFSLIPLAMGVGFIFWTRYRKNKLKIKV